jgi:hypothetical protein
LPVHDLGFQRSGCRRGKFQGAGKVYDLKISRISPATKLPPRQRSIRGGQGELSMRNAKGVTLVVLARDGKETGTRLSLGPAGVTLRLK